ncbi:MAG: alpha/beta fold hydrolase [Acidimicrobiia bacterium]
MGTVAGWEQQGSYREMRGRRLFVVDRAAEDEALEPVLVLHGFPTCSYDWAALLDGLARRRRVVIPDFLGFGMSAKPDQRYSLFEQADLVETLVDALGINRAALVSHDMGDSVAGELLARSLDGQLGFEVTGRVISNGSIYLGMAQLTDGQKLLLSLPDEMVGEDAGPTVELLVAALRATCAPDADVPEGELVGLAELIVRDGGNRLLPRTIRYVEERREHEGRWTGAIERHPAPLTIVWGDLDPIAVWPMAERLHGACPDATLVRLPGIGHYPMLEAPDAFGAALEHALDVD